MKKKITSYKSFIRRKLKTFRYNTKVHPSLNKKTIITKEALLYKKRKKKQPSLNKRTSMAKFKTDWNLKRKIAELKFLL